VRDKRYPLASWWSGSGETNNTRSKGNAPSQTAPTERDILGEPRTRGRCSLARGRGPGQRRRGNSKAEGWLVFRSPTTRGRHIRRGPRRHDPRSESRSCYVCVLASSTARGLLLKDLKAGGSARHTSGHHGLLLELWHHVPRHGSN
jgi:hypothetical protein